LTEKINILCILHDSRRSGVPAVATQVIRALPKERFRVTTLFAYEGIYADELRNDGYKVVTLGARTPLVWRIKRHILPLYLLRQGYKFDLLYIHSIKLAWVAIIAKRLGLKVVFHVHELPNPPGFATRKAMRMANVTLFCSKTCADHFGSTPARRKTTIVNALAFSDLPAVNHLLIEPRIIMAASINRSKGQHILLEAFNRLKFEKAQLWFYGTVGLSAKSFVRTLKNKVATLGLAKRVFFPGPSQDIYQVLSDAAVLVHTSYTESFGMALVEAQSRGVPVIAHDIEGMKEVIVDGETGFLIQPGDVSALAGKLDLLLENPELRNAIGQRGYAFVRENFSIDRRVQVYCDLFSEVASK
jgi:glycosyltransferase involved in cell wall biosynthesis